MPTDRRLTPLFLLAGALLLRLAALYQSRENPLLHLLPPEELIALFPWLGEGAPFRLRVGALLMDTLNVPLLWHVARRVGVERPGAMTAALLYMATPLSLYAALGPLPVVVTALLLSTLALVALAERNRSLGGFLTLLGAGGVLFLTATPLAAPFLVDDLGFAVAGGFSPLIGAPFPTIPVALGVGGPGLVLLGLRRLGGWTPLVLTAAFFYGAPPFPSPPLPLLFMGIGAFVDFAVAERRARRRVRLLPLMGVAAGLAGMVHALASPLPPDEVSRALAEGYLATDRPEEADRIATEALRAYPDQPRFAVIRGVALMRRGEKTASLAPLQKALSLDPDHADALLHFGVALLAVQRPEEAIAPLERLSRIAPSAEGYVVLGLACERAGKQGAALAAYRSAEALAPAGSRRHKAAQAAIGRVTNRNRP